MKLLMAIMMLFVGLSGNFKIGASLSVVTDYAYLYQTASFSAVKEDFVIEHGETVTLENEAPVNDFYYVSYTYKNVEYRGYVYKECLAELEKEQELVLTYKAKTSAKTKVYSISDKSKEIMEISEGKELYLYEGFDRKSEFTAVKFSYNGKIILGYVKTEDISPYGISGTLIVAITAIFACVGVIMILLGISKKKKKTSLFTKKPEIKND